jgi:hypothetical protein
MEQQPYEEDTYASDINELVENPFVFKTQVDFGKAISELIASANRGVSEVRTVDPVLAYEILEAAIYKNPLAEKDYQKLVAFRELNDFVNVVLYGEDFKVNEDNAKYLPLGHPLSPKNEEHSEEEVLLASIEWKASDPRLPEELRPMIASALKTEEGSVERAYVGQRLSSMKLNNKPISTLLDLI